MRYLVAAMLAEEGEGVAVEGVRVGCWMGCDWMELDVSSRIDGHRAHRHRISVIAWMGRGRSPALNVFMVGVRSTQK